MSSAARFAEKHSGKWGRKVAKNGSRPKSKPGCAWQAYCSECAANQQTGITVSNGQRTAMCRHGHRFELRW